MLYYNRKGQPISSTEYGQLFEAGEKQVAKTVLINDYWVSTVWLGIDHRFFGDGPPLIFETIVFRGESFQELACRRYSSEEEALAGHQAMVEEWRAKADLASEQN